MSFQRVAQLAQLAANDQEVLAALQDDPARIRKPLQLSEEQVRALVSASAFSTARPVQTTSKPEDPVADPTVLMDFGTLGTLGTLLPPEGSGAFPGIDELPPTPAAPRSSTPSHHARGPEGTPQRTGPVPQSRAPSGAPITATPHATGGLKTASPSHGSGPAIGTPQASGGAPGTVSTSSTAQGSGTLGGRGYATGQAQATGTSSTVTLGCGSVTRPGRCCGCDTGMVAITAQVSTTAQATLTALVAIAQLD